MRVKTLKPIHFFAGVILPGSELEMNSHQAEELVKGGFAKFMNPPFSPEKAIAEPQGEKTVLIMGDGKCLRDFS